MHLTPMERRFLVATDAGRRNLLHRPTYADLIEPALRFAGYVNGHKLTAVGKDARFILMRGVALRVQRKRGRR